MRARVKSPICRGGSVLPLLPFRVKMFRISMKEKKKKVSRSFFPSGIFPGTGRIPLVSSTPTSSNTSSAEEKPCPTQLLPKQELSRAPHGMTVFHSSFRKTEAKKSFTTTALLNWRETPQQEACAVGHTIPSSSRDFRTAGKKLMCDSLPCVFE